MTVAQMRRIGAAACMILPFGRGFPDLVGHSRNDVMNSGIDAREIVANHGKITLLGVHPVSEFLIVG
jgi:hypothetical protein